MGKINNNTRMIDSYLKSEHKVVSFEVWASWFTKKGSNAFSFASFTEKNGAFRSQSSAFYPCAGDEVRRLIEDINELLSIDCDGADIITIHVNDYRIIRILKFGYVPKRLFDIVRKYKELSSGKEIIFIKDKWFQKDEHNEKVDKMAKESFETGEKMMFK